MEEVLIIPKRFKKSRFEKKLSKLLREYFKLKGVEVEVVAEGDPEKFDIFIFRGKVPHLIMLEKLEEFKNFVIGDKGRVLGEKITNNCIEVYFDMTSNFKFDDRFKRKVLTPYQLLVGYDSNYMPIVIDMTKTPHVGIVGTSLSGKSKCVEMMLENLEGADITLLNCFGDDFNRIEASRINGNDNIVNYLKELTSLTERLPTPLYVVIDEYNVLSNISKIDKIIQDLLSQARHYNIFLIVIAQKGNSEDMKFKNLFNVRIAFRTLEEATLRAFLGVATHSVNMLNNREFYITHSVLQKGKTYTMQQ